MFASQVDRGTSPPVVECCRPRWSWHSATSRVAGQQSAADGAARPRRGRAYSVGTARAFVARLRLGPAQPRDVVVERQVDPRIYTAVETRKQHNDHHRLLYTSPQHMQCSPVLLRGLLCLFQQHIHCFDRMMLYAIPATHYIISSYHSSRIKALTNASRINRD